MGPCFFFWCRFECHFSVCIHIAEEERASCFILIIFMLVSCSIYSVSLRCGAMSLSVFFDCAISWLH